MSIYRQKQVLENPSSRRNLFALSVCALGVFTFFRDFFLSGGRMITGDMADGRLILSIHEHWYRFFMGKEGFFELNFFYPVKNVLGYSDTFLLGGIVHSLFRFIGLDPYLSFQLVQILTCVAGFYGMLYWLHNCRRVSYGISLFAALLFIVASPTYIGSRNSHIQVQAVWLIPWIIILLEQALIKARQSDKGLLWTITGVAFLYGIITYSTFYTAWFFMLYSGIWIITISVLTKGRVVLDCSRLLLKYWKEIIPGFLCLIAWGLLFLFTYLPVKTEQGGRPMEEIQNNFPHVLDLINRSESNLLWGKLASIINLKLDPVPFSNEIGLSICLLAFLTFFFVQSFRFPTFKKDYFPEKVTLIATAVSLLLLVKYGNFSLWYIPFSFVPGGDAIRVLQRFEIFLLVPCVFLTARGLMWICTLSKGPARALFLFTIGVILLTEQIHSVTNAHIDRQEELSFLRSLPEPPADALAFEVRGRYSWTGELAVLQNTAIILSQFWDKPTVSGRSGFCPEGWTMRRFSLPENTIDLIYWGKLHNLEGKVYVFNLDDSSWDGFVQFPTNSTPLVLPQPNLLDPESFAYISGKGWSRGEQWGTWNDGKESVLNIPPLQTNSSKVIIKIGLFSFIHKNLPFQHLKIKLDDDVVYENTFSAKYRRDSIEIELPDQKVENGFTLRFLAENAASPQSLGGHDDQRLLGVGLTHLSIED